MQLTLQILRKESKSKFLKRWKVVLRAATAIGNKMYEHRHEGTHVGAIQAPDIVREELERASEQAMNPKVTRRFVSLKVSRMAEWAGG